MASTVLDINVILKKTDKAIKHLLGEQTPSREYLPTAYDCCLTQQILNSDATRSVLSSVKTEMELEIDSGTTIKADVDLSLVEKRRFMMTDDGARWLKRAAKDILDSNENTSHLLLRVLKRARQGVSEGLMDQVPVDDAPTDDESDGADDQSDAGNHESGARDNVGDDDDDDMVTAWGDGLAEECCDEEDAELKEALKRYKSRNDEEEDSAGDGDDDDHHPLRRATKNDIDDDDEDLDDDAFDSNLEDNELDQLYQ